MDDIRYLQQSFDAFQQSSARLQEIYEALQRQIAHAAVELEEKNAELLRLSAEREGMKNYLESILENLTVGVLVTDAAGVVGITNRAALSLLQQNREDILGVPVAQLFGESLPFEARHGDVAENNTAGRRISRDGRILEVFSSALAAARGDGSGSAWVIYDITETLKLEKQARLNEKNAAMLEMAARIAHEVRNPLGSIELFSSLLQRHVQGGKPREWVGQIIGAVENIDRKIESLLRYVKTVEPLMEVLDVHEILRQVLLYSDCIADQGHVFLSVEYDTGTAAVRGNPAMLRRIFTGMVLNALKSITGEGRIHIRTQIDHDGQGGSTVSIGFADNRPGNPGDHIRRFFNPEEEDERLAGFNFAVIRNIVTMHQGTLSAESGGDGTVSFRVILPLVKP